MTQSQAISAIRAQLTGRLQASVTLGIRAKIPYPQTFQALAHMRDKGLAEEVMIGAVPHYRLPQ